MLILFLISEIIARVSDRIRGRGAHRTDRWADDETSQI
jgi:sec-independent protein translocase protein TatC